MQIKKSLITIRQLKNLAESIGATVELVVFKPDTVSARVSGEDGSYKIQISESEPLSRQKYVGSKQCIDIATLTLLEDS